MKPRPVEVLLLPFLKSLGTSRCLLAISGGSDSMALLYACASLQKKVKCTFVVGHVHHGSNHNREFRDQAQKMVKEVAQDLQIPFVTNSEGHAASSSEADLRRFRREQLKQFMHQTACDYVIFAHHADDLLETRLIRLIRGTGPQGVKAMSQKMGQVLRPFLTLSKKQLSTYLESLNGLYLEDESNHSVNYLRNWIRHKWLHALELKRPGARESLARSLESISEALDERPDLSFCYENDRIVRTSFITLTTTDKRRVLGDYLLNHGIKDFGLSHINELIKRLDVEQKDLTFSLLKKIWLANAKHIWCE